MTVELVTVIVCDGCGVTRGHEDAKDIVRATRELRRSAHNLRGWSQINDTEDLCGDCTDGDDGCG